MIDLYRSYYIKEYGNVTYSNQSFNELHLVNIYTPLLWLLTVPYMCGIILLAASAFDITPYNLWSKLKLRIAKDIFGEKGITSIPDNCEYTKKLILLIFVILGMDLVVNARIRNFDEEVICIYLFKIIMILLLPATLSLIFGGSFIKYLRGEISKSSILFESIIDFPTLLSFLGRFLAQISRYIFLLAKMWLFLIAMEDFAYQWVLYGKPHKHYLLLYNITTCIIIDIWQLTLKILIFIVNFINMFFALYSQIGALLIVIWWLLAAIYSTGKQIWDFIKNNKNTNLKKK